MRSTTPISARKIVGKRTRKPQKMKACMRPGHEALEQLPLAEHDVASLRTRAGSSSNRCDGLARAGRGGRGTARGGRRARPRRRAQRRARARRAASPSAGRGAPRRLRASCAARPRSRAPPRAGRRSPRSRRLARIGASGSVLTARIAFAPLQPAMCCVAPGDAARDVDLRRDLVPRLPHLVGVRTPAGHRHRPRAADRAAEQAGELLDRREALGRADAAAAGDDDLGVRERDAAGRRRDRSRTRTTRSASASVGREALDRARRSRPRPPATACGATVSSARPRVQVGLLEQAPAPAHAGERDGVARRDLECSSRRAARRAAQRRAPSPRCRRRCPGATTAVAPIWLAELADDRAPRRPGANAPSASCSATWATAAGTPAAAAAPPGPDQQRLDLAAEAGGERQRLQRDVGRRRRRRARRGRDSRCHPDLLEQVDDGGAASAP